MKITPEKRLFWYLKDDAKLNLEDPSQLDMFVQQVLSHGNAEDIRKLIKMIKPEVLKKSFDRIKRYLPKEVKLFWEDGLGNTG
ncbi:MAG: hypothetical protein ACOC6P_04200 [Candidatus Aminicenantaceae bacterium]